MRISTTLGAAVLASLTLAACSVRQERFVRVGPPGTAVGDLSGSAAATPSGNAAVAIPPGALPADVAVEVNEITAPLPNDGALLGSAFEFSPSGTQFDIPVTISLELPGAVSQEAVVVWLNESTGVWEPLPGSVVMDGRVYAQTTHFSFYGVSLPPGPTTACQQMLVNSPPNTVHPLVTPNALQVRGATKTEVQPSGFSGPNALELGSTWVASQRFVEVTGNAGIPGEGGIIDWSTFGGDTFTIGANGDFSFWLDLHSEGPFFGLTDACLAPTADEHHGWLYNLSVHCDQACWDDPATSPPSGSTCGARDLCQRSINQCGVQMTQTQCEGWYQNAANCADMAAYESCNCACITEPTCQDYFDCGQVCFNNHC